MHLRYIIQMYCIVQSDTRLSDIRFIMKNAHLS